MLTHSGKKSHGCEKCGKFFTNRYILKTHILNHCSKKKFKVPTTKPCVLCANTFNPGPEMRNHMLTHSGGRHFECVICGKSIKRALGLKVHLLTHSSKEYKCGYCEQSFKQPSQLKKHTMKHTGEKPHKCSYCDNASAFKDCVKMHELTHTGISPDKAKDTTWAVCQKIWLTPSRLKTHMQKHSEKKPYSCNECGKSFRFRAAGALKDHMQIHIRESELNISKRKPCVLCGEMFLPKGVEMKEHMLIHSKGKPFKCEICGDLIKHAKLFKKHLLIHTREPYKCTYCERSFKLQCQLKVHTMVHTVLSVITDVL